MFYEAELRLLRDTFRNCRIPTWIVQPFQTVPSQNNGPASHLFTGFFSSDLPLKDRIPPVSPETVYRFTDSFSCRYIYLLLPELPQQEMLIIGPFVEQELSSQQILELCEKKSLNPAQSKQLKSYFSGVSVLPNNSHLLALLDTFCQHIWGTNSFALEDNSQSSQKDDLILPKTASSSEEKDVAWHIKNMELRYHYENELLAAVMKGQSHKADLLFGNSHIASFEQRLSDPVRNAKNYCIIMNTLLRKAAEQGGVHPVYLDSTSSAFAAKIEQVNSQDAIPALMREIFQTYCQLVRKHNLRGYSPLIQKVITYIDTDLTGNLSLRHLSTALNVSGSYLSTLFKKEMGQTLTEYVNHRRIDYARQLLETTNMQVQTVAQYCGIVDVQYFSKIFKRITKQTPKAYREAKSTGATPRWSGKTPGG